MADWQETATRGLSILSGDTSEESTRTKDMLSHVRNLSNRDEYISKDFFNVRQTAGGLPEGITFQQYVDMVAGHLRSDLASSSFDSEVDDDSFRSALLSIDENIRRHIRFLNGVVHQAAPGEVHMQLWQRILDARRDAASIYSCYRDYLVDA